jgi:hypothetical protein
MEMAGAFLIATIELLVLAGVYWYVDPKRQFQQTHPSQKGRLPSRVRAPSIVPDEISWRS